MGIDAIPRDGGQDKDEKGQGGSGVQDATSSTVPAAPPVAQPPPEKIRVKVVAQSIEGEAVAEFNMKPETVFEKMMKAWCQQQSLPLNAAIFMFKHENRKLQPEESPGSCGWSVERGAMVIEAQPTNVGTTNVRTHPAVPAAGNRPAV